MKPSQPQRDEWLRWVRVTSIPLVQLGVDGAVVAHGDGMMLNHAGCRFVLAVEHVVKRDATGWAVVVQQDGHGRMEYYQPNFFSYVGEIKSSSGEVRLLDLCAAQVSPDLETWYEYRTPQGLFDKVPHHIFDERSLSEPTAEEVYAFSGQVRTERHGPNALVSDMVIYPGLRYSHTEREIHHFKLPVTHPGHDAFQGCSGSPLVDTNRNVVALVVGGDIPSNTVKGIAIDRVLSNLEFLASSGEA